MKFRYTILVSLLPIVLYSQINKLKLDSLFELLEASNKAMASIAISKSGQIIYNNSIGYSCIKDSTKSNINTKFKIGSVTKMFTATLIFQLIEQNKLTLKTPLSKFYPNIPNSPKISIEQLLYHRSGIYDYVQDSLYLKSKMEVISKEKYIDILEKSVPYFKPDSTFMYSNSNYILLGYIIEKISNSSYSQALNDRILSKVDLKNTYCGGRINCSNSEALPYELINSTWTEQEQSDMTLPGGAGCIESTPSDLIKFIDALFSYKLVSTTSLKKMITLKEDAGMGMFSFPFYEKKSFGHSGGIDSYHSMLACFPTDSLSIAYCSNGEVFPMNDILLGVLSCCFDKKYRIPDFGAKFDKHVDLNQYIGVYANANLHMNMLISIVNMSLIAQATGQPPFPLEPFAEDKFKFEKAGLIIEFQPKNNILILFQSGGSYPFKKIK